MNVPSYIKLTTSTQTSNYVLPILLEIDNQNLISARRIFKKSYSGDEKSVNDMIEVEIQIQRETDFLISVSNFFYKWLHVHNQHTIHTSEHLFTKKELTEQNIFKLLTNSSDIYID